VNAPPYGSPPVIVLCPRLADVGDDASPLVLASVLDLVDAVGATHAEVAGHPDDLAVLRAVVPSGTTVRDAPGGVPGARVLDGRCPPVPGADETAVLRVDDPGDRRELVRRLGAAGDPSPSPRVRSLLHDGR
jgi:hypothetical protein